MRRFALTIAAAAAIFSAGALTSDRAEAMTIGTPSGLVAALEGFDLAEDVRYVCRRVWRCNYRGCGWRRVCHWRPGPYRPYRPYRSYRRYR